MEPVGLAAPELLADGDGFPLVNEFLLIDVFNFGLGLGMEIS